MQALYEADITGHGLEHVLEQRRDERGTSVQMRLLFSSHGARRLGESRDSWMA